LVKKIYFFICCVCGAGWPSLHWFVTENLSKPPRDWLPPARPADNAPAYVEVGSVSFYFCLFILTEITNWDSCTESVGRWHCTLMLSSHTRAKLLHRRQNQIEPDNQRIIRLQWMLSPSLCSWCWQCFCIL